MRLKEMQKNPFFQLSREELYSNQNSFKYKSDKLINFILGR
jgi:hypothetical protein